MNASNVPLNAEEQRNARFQGPFKWFINHFGTKYNEILFGIGLFSKRDLIRMVDARIYSDIVYAIEYGIQTTKSAELSSLYRQYNVAFDEEDSIETRMSFGFDRYIEHTELHDSQLLKHHILQTFVLIFISDHFGLGLGDQAATIAPPAAEHVARQSYPLDQLIAAIGDPEQYPELISFVGACKVGTNVAEARAIRYLYFKQAMTQE
jgi:hypothetical protein